MCILINLQFSSVLKWTCFLIHSNGTRPMHKNKDNQIHTYFKFAIE